MPENNEVSALDAARSLGIDLNRVYVLLRLGRLQGRKVDGEWRIPGPAVQKRLAQRASAESLSA